MAIDSVDQIDDVESQPAVPAVAPSTTYFVNTYGDYSYGPNIATIDVSLPIRMRTSVPANTAGGFSAGGIVDARKFTIEGTLLATDLSTIPNATASLRSQWDAFLKAHAPGSTQQFQLDSDRYINAEVASITSKDPWGGEPYRNYSIEFYCADPFWYDVVPTSFMLGQTFQSYSVAAGGTVFCLPAFIFSVSEGNYTTATGPGAPGNSTITISDASGNSLTINQVEPGTLVVNSETNQIQLNGTSVQLYSGTFPILQPGGNNINISQSSDVVLAEPISVIYQNRWL